MYWNFEYGIYLKKIFVEFCNLFYFFRYGVYNWEGFGVFIVIFVFFVLIKFVQEYSWVVKKIDLNWVVYVGI